MTAIDLILSGEEVRFEEVGDVVIGEVACLVLELIEGYADLEALHLLDPLHVLLVDRLLLHHLSQDVQEELIGVGAARLIGLELLLKLARNRYLLRLEETLQKHVNGKVDVIGADIVTQVHLCMRLRHAQDGLDVADGD